MHDSAVVSVRVGKFLSTITVLNSLFKIPACLYLMNTQRLDTESINGSTKTTSNINITLCYYNVNIFNCFVNKLYFGIHTR